MEKIKFIKQKESEIIKLLSQLVKIPSQNGIDDERKIAEFIVGFLRQFDFETELIGDRKRPSVLCSIGKKGSSLGLFLKVK